MRGWVGTWLSVVRGVSQQEWAILEISGMSRLMSPYSQTFERPLGGIICSAVPVAMHTALP